MSFNLMTKSWLKLKDITIEKKRLFSFINMEKQKIQRRLEKLVAHSSSNEKEKLSHYNQKFLSSFSPELTKSNVASSKSPVVYSSISEIGVAIIHLNNPPVNACSNELLSGLRQELLNAFDNVNVNSVVLISDIKNFFIAGADLSMIQKMQAEPGLLSIQTWIKTTGELMNLLETGKKPTVAAIDGISLGGGLEIPMSCNGRICTSQSTLGLPELKIGLIPGWGGTQRLPRLVGMKTAIDMMIHSENVKGPEALKLGLVDSCINDNNNYRDKLLMAACELAHSMASGKTYRKMSLYHYKKLEPLEEMKQMIKKALVEAEKTNPFVPHARACLTAMKAGIVENGIYGLGEEYRQFMICASSNTSRSLIHLFFAERATSKLRGLENVKPLKIEKVCVIGGGVMGSGITVAFLLAGYRVLLKELNEKLVSVGLDRVKSLLMKRVSSKRMNPKQYDEVLLNLRGTTNFDIADFGNLDIVIEAVFEDIKLKQGIFQTLEKVCSSSCILATNTSSLDVDKISEKVVEKQRIIGMHFFTPAHVMPLLEIVKVSSTSKDVLATTLDIAKRIKKIPVVVGNCVGFAVNRIFHIFAIVCSFLVDGGIHPYDIDEIMQNSFGMPAGPFRVYDLVGMDTFVHVTTSIGSGYEDLQYPPKIFKVMLEHNRLGQKNGIGFYNYTSGKPEKIPKELQKILDENIVVKKKLIFKETNTEITQLFLFPCVNEALKVVEEGFARPSDIDIASCLGMGFPRHLGGILKYGQHTGFKTIFDKLNHLHKTHGEKFLKPCELLKKLAAHNSTFDLYAVNS